jgi:hypothetical protein
MFRSLLRACGVRVRESGESCATCRHFSDLADPNEPDDDDDIQKCGYLIDTLGFTKAIEIDPYGGPWIHRNSWCRQWEVGPSLWVRVESPQSSDAVDPHAADSGKPSTREEKE